MITALFSTDLTHFESVFKSITEQTWYKTHQPSKETRLKNSQALLKALKDLESEWETYHKNGVFRGVGQNDLTNKTKLLFEQEIANVLKELQIRMRLASSLETSSIIYPPDAQHTETDRFGRFTAARVADMSSLEVAAEWQTWHDALEYYRATGKIRIGKVDWALENEDALEMGAVIRYNFNALNKRAQEILAPAHHPPVSHLRPEETKLTKAEQERLKSFKWERPSNQSYQERLASIKKLLSLETLVGWLNAENPLLRATGNLSAKDYQNILAECTKDEEGLANFVKSKFGTMAYAKDDAGNFYPGGFIGRDDDDNPAFTLVNEVRNDKSELKFKRCQEGKLGLRANDSVAATILWQMIVGLLNAPSYKEGVPAITLPDGRQIAGCCFTGEVAKLNGFIQPATDGGVCRKLVKQLADVAAQRLALYGIQQVEETEDSFDIQSDIWQRFISVCEDQLRQEADGSEITPAQVIRYAQSAFKDTELAYAFATWATAKANPLLVFVVTKDQWTILRDTILDPVSEVDYNLHNLCILDDQLALLPFEGKLDAQIAYWFFKFLERGTPQSIGFGKNAGAKSLRKPMFVEERCTEQLEFRAVRTGYKVHFQSSYWFIESDGNVSDNRGRKINNVAMVNPSINLNQREATEKDVTLLTPVSALVWGTCSSIVKGFSSGKDSLVYSKTNPRWADLYKYLMSKALPVDSEEEAGGCLVGDREYHNKYVTKTYTWSGLMPWTFSGQVGLEFVRRIPRFVQISEYTSINSSVPEVMLSKYNLYQLPQGTAPFIDARLIGFGLREIADEDTKIAIATQLLEWHWGHKHIMDNLLEVMPELKFNGITKLATGEWKDDRILYDTILFGIDNYFERISTKYGKVGKRARHRYPKAALPLGPQATYQAFVPIGHREPSLVHALRGIYAPFLPAPAGQSFSIGKELLPPFAVPGSTQKDLEGIESGDIALVAEYDTKATETSKEYIFTGTASMLDQEYTGALAEKGQVIFIGHAKNKDGKLVPFTVKAPKKCIVESVSVTTGFWGELQVKVRYVMIQRNGKYRGNHKTMIVRIYDGYIYNQMNAIYNPKLRKDIQVIITGDADKCKDLLMGMLEVVAQTLVQTEKGRQLLAEVNELVHVTSDKHLVYSDIVASLGGYDHLIQYFNQEYLRSLWFQTVDCADNYVRAVYETYSNKAAKNIKGWKEISVKRFLEEYPEAASVLGTNFKAYTDGDLKAPKFGEVSLTCSEGEIKVAHANVMVFFRRHEVVNGENVETNHLWTRTAAYVGNDDHSLLIPNKVEISTVDQASGNLTRCMAGVARLIDAGIDCDSSVSGQPAQIERNHRLANDLMADVQASLQKWSVFQAMNNNGDIMAIRNQTVKVGDKYALKRERATVTRIPLVTFQDGTAKATPAIKNLLAEARYASLKAKALNKTLKFTDLAHAFKDYSFTFVWKERTTQLYLPAIIEQDANPTSKESLSGMVKSIFICLLTDIEPEDWRVYLARIQAFLNTVATSRKTLKKANNGRLSPQCKTQVVFGIPTHTICVPYAPDQDYSIYDSFVKAFANIGVPEEEIDGQVAITTRSPIIFAAPKRIQITKPITEEEYAKANYVLSTGDTTELSFAEALNLIVRWVVCSTHSQASMSPMIPHVSGGDNDGDVYVHIVVDSRKYKVKLTTYKMVMDYLLTRTGVGGTSAEQGGYIVDHCFMNGWTAKGIKDPRAAKPKNSGAYVRYPVSSDIMQLQGVSVAEADKIENVNALDGFYVETSAAMQTFKGFVGMAHGLATHAEIGTGLLKILKPIFANYLPTDALVVDETHWLYDELTLSAFEYYEGNPLGGLSKEGWEMNQEIRAALVGRYKQAKGKITLPDNWSKTVAAAGMNASKASQLYYCACWQSDVTKWANEGLPKDVKQDVETFLKVATHLGHLIGRARYAPCFEYNSEDQPVANPHLQLALFFMNWQRDNAELRKAMAENSVFIQFLMSFMKQAVPQMFPSQVARENICKMLGITTEYASAIIDLANLHR